MAAHNNRMANFIPKAFIAACIADTDILDIIRPRLQLKNAGHEYKACCPFHHEKTPSFTVSPKKQFYHCFGCGAHGNALNFLMEYDGLDFVSAIESLAQHLGRDIPREEGDVQFSETKPLYQANQISGQFFAKALQSDQEALSYLQKRGLSDAIIAAYQLGVSHPAADAWLSYCQQQRVKKDDLSQAGLLGKGQHGYYPRFRDRIMFPIHDIRGRVIGFGGRTLKDDPAKYLNSPETDIFHKGDHVYGLYEAKQQLKQLDQVLVVEGYMDVIALAQFGLPQAVATLGTAVTPNQLKLCFRHCSTLIFCFDGDKAGKRAAWKALTTTLTQLRDGLQAKIFMLPDGEDPDSYIRQVGLEKFQQEMNSATSIEDYFFTELQQREPIGDAASKARFAKMAMDYLQQIRPGLFKTFMLQRLSDLLEIDLEQLENLLIPIEKPAQPMEPQEAIPAAQEQSLSSSMKMALSLIIQSPAIAKHCQLPEDFNNYQLLGCKLLSKLLTLCQNSKGMTTGQLLLISDNPGIKSLIAELSVWQHNVVDDLQVEAFQQCIDKISKQHNQQRIKGLIAKARAKGLSDTEKQLLSELLQQTR